jgi:hypothetical protein
MPHKQKLYDLTKYLDITSDQITDNSDSINFIKRTDAAAVKIGCNVEDLCDKLDLSRSSLFSYRTGKRPISSKAWAKLEKLESEIRKDDCMRVSEKPEIYITKPSKKTDSATKEDIQDYINLIIKHAEKDPDGLSYLFKTLKKHIDINDFT